MREPYVPKYLLFQRSEAKKKEGIHCCAISCKKKPHKKKAGLCDSHWIRHRKIIDPVGNRYTQWKANAKNRRGGKGIPFHVTLQEFREFCDRTGYIIEKGKRGRRCTLDRIRNNEGYHKDNLQILTAIANVVKYNGVDKHVTELPTDHPDWTPF